MQVQISIKGNGACAKVQVHKADHSRGLIRRADTEAVSAVWAGLGWSGSGQ